MGRFLRRAPSPSLVISLIALFVAMGGAGYAAFALPKNSVGTKQLKKNAVTTSKIKNGSVTASKLNTKGVTVPNATNASHASTADDATNASHASTADNATNASHASNADQLGGVPAASYVQTSTLSGGAFIAPPEVLDHPLTNTCAAAGNPNQWVDRSDDVNLTIGYVRDSAGFVHLQGSAFRCGTASAVIFTLPAGYRPGNLAHDVGIDQTTADVESAIAVDVSGNGQVSSSVPVGDSASLDGITFRCAPSGSNGCP